MTYSNDIKDLLEITDPNIIFNEGCMNHEPLTINGIIYKPVSATLSYDPDVCPCCDAPNINKSILKHGFKLLKVKYACSLACPRINLLKK